MNIRWLPEARAWILEYEPEDREGKAICEVLFSKNLAFWKARRGIQVPELAWFGLKEQVEKEKGKRFDLDRAWPTPGRTPIGEELTYDLMPHQVEALEMIVGGRVLDASEMGMGKTRVALRAFQYFYSEKEVDALLVLGTLRALNTTWKEELAAEGLDEGDDPPIVLCNYDKIWRKDTHQSLTTMLCENRTMLVMDEVHLLASNDSKRSLVAKELATHAAKVLGLTGTPVRNKAESFLDLYRLLTGARVSGYMFTELFGPFLGRYYNLDKLAPVFARIGFRFLKRDLQYQLPEQKVNLINVPLSPEHSRLYHELRHNWRVEMLDAYGQNFVLVVRWSDILAHFTRLLEMASHPMLLGHSMHDREVRKLSVTKELLEEAGSQRVVIWSCRPRVLDWLEERVRKWGYTTLVVHGEKGGNEKAISEFKAGEAQVLLASVLAFSEGLNLEIGTVGIYWDLPERFDKMAQAMARIHRMTSTLPVSHYVLMGEGTIEVDAWERLERKHRHQELLTGREEPLKVEDREWLMKVLSREE